MCGKITCKVDLNKLKTTVKERKTLRNVRESKLKNI